jgi:uncharacterized coiled-coil protein SlyX
MPAEFIDGLPPGGLAREVLRRNSDQDYDARWWPGPIFRNVPGATVEEVRALNARIASLERKLAHQAAVPVPNRAEFENLRARMVELENEVALQREASLQNIYKMNLAARNR